MSYLIDRRLNGRNKSAVNRVRFLRRYKTQIRDAVKKMVGERSLRDMEQGGKVRIPRKDINEPSFGYGSGGDREFVLPGNRTYTKGDRIARPQNDQNEGEGGSAGGEGEGVDEFAFTLSREEFMEIFFDDLELPRMARTMFGEVKHHKSVRAGYTLSGSPINLAVLKTLSNALARRIALKSGIEKQLTEARAEQAEHSLDPIFYKHTSERIAQLENRLSRIPFLEELDLRYRRRTLVPETIARAVMFCLMDVSASMDENKKDLAKRFYTLLYLFLTRKYQKVELVFIRHTDDAEEVDEDTFFHDPKTGGTVVLTALDLMHDILRDRYNDKTWNIYAAQASDGDAFGSDPAKSARFLAQSLLPTTRYFAYLELTSEADARVSSLWAEYELLQDEADNFAMKRAYQREDIYPVFRELFRKGAT